jgi:hypothetical protein
MSVQWSGTSTRSRSPFTVTSIVAMDFPRPGGRPFRRSVVPAPRRTVLGIQRCPPVAISRGHAEVAVPVIAAAALARVTRRAHRIGRPARRQVCASAESHTFTIEGRGGRAYTRARGSGVSRGTSASRTRVPASVPIFGQSLGSREP